MDLETFLIQNLATARVSSPRCLSSPILPQSLCILYATYTTLLFQESNVIFYLNVPGQQTMANTTQATNGSVR